MRKEIKKYSIENLGILRYLNSDFCVLDLENFVADYEHLKQPHRYNFYTLIFALSGTAEHNIDFKDYCIIPNRIFFINYGQVHSFIEQQKLQGFIVLFTQEFYNIIFTGNPKIKSDTALANLHQYIDLTKEELECWTPVFRLIKKEAEQNAINSKEIICLLLKAFMVKYNRKQSIKNTIQKKFSKKDETVLNFKNLIGQHYKEWKLPKLYAEKLLLSPNYLNKLCNDVLGVAASKLIEERVVLEAKRLLTHTDFTVTQISDELGFADNSHFGKYFKTNAKMSPELYRTSFLKTNKLSEE